MITRLVLGGDRLQADLKMRGITGIVGMPGSGKSVLTMCIGFDVPAFLAGKKWNSPVKIEKLTGSTSGIRLFSDPKDMYNNVAHRSKKKFSEEDIAKHDLEKYPKFVNEQLKILFQGDVRALNPLRWGFSPDSCKPFLVFGSAACYGQLPDRNGLLVMDDVAGNMHPIAAIMYADMLVLLHKKLGLQMILASNNQDFWQAIHLFSRKYKVENHVDMYKMKNVGENACDCVKATRAKDWDDVFGVFTEAVDFLQDLRSSIEEAEEAEKERKK